MTLPIYYLFWHYVLSWRDFFRLWGNFFWFWSHFFSISTIIRTFLSPWRRLREPYGHWYEFSAVLSSIFINLVMRLVGVVMRTILLAAALVSLILLFVLTAAAIAVWLLLPLGAIFLAVIGVYLLF